MGSASPLDERVALVTGSTRGIGWSTACALADAGATVIVNGRDSGRVDERVAALKERSSAEAVGLPFDISDPGAVQNAFKGIREQFGRLDVLVNNAGILEDALLGMITEEAVRRTFATNTFGLIYAMQAASRIMKRAGGGSIVNVSSIIGTRGNIGQVVYSASKASVIGATLSAAKELAPANIRVNVVTPGFIDTEMIKHLSDDVVAERLSGIRMGRIGEPDDVAGVIVFLASPASSYVTGQVIGVDGGMIV